MRRPVSKNRQIEFVFPVMIFFAFTLSALIVILFAAQVYQRTVADAAMNYNANTSLSYIREKIHQHDNGRIGVTTFDGSKAVVMKEKFGDDWYATYIYAANGALRELFIKDGMEANFTASSGQAILEIADFNVEVAGDRLLSFSCTDKDGQTATARVGVYAGDLVVDNSFTESSKTPGTAAATGQSTDTSTGGTP